MLQTMVGLKQHKYHNSPLMRVVFLEKQMTNRTPDYRLRANAAHEKKLKRKNVIFNQSDDAELLKAIDNDSESFSPLVINLLKKHYGL